MNAEEACGALGLLVGETITAVKVDSGMAERPGGRQFDRVVIETVSGRRFVIETEDTEGYCSWLSVTAEDAET